jgi:hypothetical protein
MHILKNTDRPQLNDLKLHLMLLGRKQQAKPKKQRKRDNKNMGRNQ